MKHSLLYIFLFIGFASNSQINLYDNVQVNTHFEAETAIDSSWYESGYFNTGVIVDFPDVYPLWNGQHKDFERIIVDKFEAQKREVKKAFRKRDEFEIMLRFTVSEKGLVSKVAVVSGGTSRIENELIRIIEGGNWTKGEHRGKPVPYLCSLKVVFTKQNK